MQDHFLSCDWGTSSFRLRLIHTNSLKVMGESHSDEGVATVYQAWQKEGKSEKERFPFYTAVLQRHIAKLELEMATNLNETPIVISGMASSSIGMVELPYKHVPFEASGADLYCSHIKSSSSFKHHITLISGVQTATDVMRGEETQVAGYLESANETQLLIVPGTHSKHIVVRDKRIVDFKTYMTGELFELLGKKSILAGSVKEGSLFSLANGSAQSFDKGVEMGSQQNMLHGIFSVRTNALFKKFTPEENYAYLSGLLIGAELKELTGNAYPLVTIIGNNHQAERYSHALQLLNANLKIATASTNEATVKGQYKIAIRPGMTGYGTKAIKV